MLTAGNLEGMLRELLMPMDRRKVFENLRSPTSQAKADTVETMFEDFVAFVDSVVGNFLPWLLRGLESISPHGSEAAGDIEWVGMAREIELRLAAVGGAGCSYFDTFWRSLGASRCGGSIAAHRVSGTVTPT